MHMSYQSLSSNLQKLITKEPDVLEPRKPDYEKIGKDMSQILARSQKSNWPSFMHGFFAGLGGVVGATVGVAVLVFVLGWLGGIPFVGQYIKGLVDIISGS